MTERQPIREAQPFTILFVEMEQSEKRMIAKIDRLQAKLDKHMKQVESLNHEMAQAGLTLESIRKTKDHFQEMMER